MDFKGKNRLGIKCFDIEKKIRDTKEQIRSLRRQKIDKEIEKERKGKTKRQKDRKINNKMKYSKDLKTKLTIFKI